MKTVNTNRLNQLWKEGVLPKIKALLDDLTESINGVDEKIDVLDTKEEIEANTDEEKMAGALAVKGMFGEINSNLPIQTKAIITGKNEYYVSSSTCVKLSNNYIISFTIGTQATYTQNTLKNIGSSTVKPPYLKYGIALVMSGNVVLGIASIYLDQNGELFLNANFTANFLVINCFLII